MPDIATITYMTFLMVGTGTGTITYSKLCPIKDYPDFMNDVNTIDVTDLEHKMHVYARGLLDTGGDMAFTANYTLSDYQTVKALDDGTVKHLALYFGGNEAADGTITPTGSDGKWLFDGYVTAGIVGKGADESREMQIHVVPASDMTFSTT
jgi:hypothetical protein